MKKLLLVVLAVCMTICLFPVTAMANDSTLGGTGITVYPIYDTDVVMEEEIIDILVKNGKTYVKCQFFFHNTGDKETLLVGFPTQPPGGYKSQEDLDGEKAEDEYYNEYHVTELYGFRSYIDGKRVPVKIKKGLEPWGNNSDGLYFPQWYTWNMTIGKDERVKVVNTYYMENSFGGENSEYTEYILRTGSTWKGAVGKITVRMKFEGYDMFDVSFDGMPPSYVRDDGTIVWKAKNIEPKEDISASFQTPEYYEDLENPFEVLEPGYAQYDRMGIRMLRNFYIKHYNGTTWWGNKFLRKFGDKQSSEFYYVMGYSYYKLGRYEKALQMFDKARAKNYWGDIACLYYTARSYGKTGNTAKYKEYLEKIIQECFETNPSMIERVDWVFAWAQSRLKDVNIKTIR